jgi:hypothetical protein
MHFLFNVLRIKDLYIFWALLAHPQELLDKRHSVYCVRMSVGCETETVPQPTDIIRTQYTNVVCAANPEDEQIKLETRRGLMILNKFNEKCITLISFYWYTIMHGQQNVKYWSSFVGITPAVGYCCRSALNICQRSCLRAGRYDDSVIISV